MHFRSALLCLGLAVAAWAAGDGLDAALNKMDQANATFKTVSAGVRRLSHTAVINEDNVDSGTMLLKRPKPHDVRMLVDLTQPDPKSVALQGKKVEIFYPRMNTVQEFDVGKNRALLDQFFMLGFGTSRRELEAANTMRYLGDETLAGEKTWHLELIPKSPEVLQHLKKFELWISEATGYPAQQKFFLPGGDYMLVTYSNLKINPDLPDSALKLRLPKGVKREYPQK